MTWRDVTELLAVDPGETDPDTVERAVALINADQRAVVASDDDAVAVLVSLGVNEDYARSSVQHAAGAVGA